MLRKRHKSPAVPILLVAILIPIAILAGCESDSTQPEPDPGAGPPETIPGLVLVPAGTFSMGSPDAEVGRGLWEGSHEVTLTEPFYLSEREITQQEWEDLMGWNDSMFPGPRLPADALTWFDALEYCNRISEREGLTPAYTLSGKLIDGVHVSHAIVTWNRDSPGYRLPTEAEWEYACRAGSTTALANGEIVHLSCSPLDPNLDLIAWYCGNSGIEPHDVMGKAPNAWGLYDMHGNASEWCWDWAGAYAPEPAEDPIGPAIGNTRVIRGGTWYAATDGTFTFGSELCRSASRGLARPGEPLIGVGLRIARKAS